MEVHFTPEQEAQLSQIASHAGTDTERLVKDAALRLLEQDARFRGAVREGIAQADREEFIEEEEMDARIERMLKSWCVSGARAPRACKASSSERTRPKWATHLKRKTRDSMTGALKSGAEAPPAKQFRNWRSDDG